ncbi:hypothetical protein FRC07_013336 [Ceratobasidium sp. 392]|nr:hypothetical protein FRC07_013336 [Ceratobasidium sp. 392]
MNALRIVARHRVRAARPVVPIRGTRLLRPFSSTPAWRASEDSDSFMAGFRNSPLFNQLAEKPEALAALSKMAEFMKKNSLLHLSVIA